MLTIGPDSKYHEWNREFPIQKLWTIDGLKKANAQMAKVDAVPRSERDAGMNAYIGTLQAVIQSYIDEQTQWLLNENKPDVEVLKFCIAAYNKLDDEKPEDVAFICQTCGIPPANLAAVLAGTRHLSRVEILKLCAQFGCSQCLFDGSLRYGRAYMGRFRVMKDYSGRYLITDSVSRQEVSREPSECAVFITDCNGQPYRLHHESLGFEEALGWNVNRDVDATLKTYFPKVWDKEFTARMQRVDAIDPPVLPEVPESKAEAEERAQHGADEVAQLQEEAMGELADAKRLVAEAGIGRQE